jgi:putative thiazole-containing bacteriocin maturation protein
MDKLPIEMVGRFDSQMRLQIKVLAVGAGSFLASLVAALFETGLSKVHVTLTSPESTDRRLLTALAENIRKTDPKAELKELTMPKRTVTAWRERVQPFDWILYGCQEEHLEEIQAIHSACRAEKKSLLITTCIGQTGLAGPLVHPDTEGCWESARRRMHQSALRNVPMASIFNPAAGPMLANIIVFDMFRTITRVMEPEMNNKFFLLDLNTLEGSYHSFLPHPLITGGITTKQVYHWEQLLGRGKSSNGDSNNFLTFISRLTSLQSGILHLWDEGDLRQFPLSQCRVQAIDPLSEGSSELLPINIRAGLTHMEARKEAGLAGIEDYVTRIEGLSAIPFHLDQKSSNWNTELSEYVGIGAGETAWEAVYRGLQKCLSQQLRQRTADRKPAFSGVQIGYVEDTLCRYYLHALTIMQGAPTIGLGEDLFGFPVIWIGTPDYWYGSAGLNRTLALRMTLQQALLRVQNPAETLALQCVEISSLDWEEGIVTNLEIKAVEHTAQAEWVQVAVSVLKHNQMRLMVFEIRVEPFLNEHLGGLFGVLLEKEEASR